MQNSKSSKFVYVVVELPFCNPVSCYSSSAKAAMAVARLNLMSRERYHKAVENLKALYGPTEYEFRRFTVL